MEFLPIRPRSFESEPRVRGASGMHRGTAPVSPHEKGKLAQDVRAGGIHGKKSVDED
jgi:hypothetical protein